VSAELSGSFAFGYDSQFFLAIAVGIVGLKRRQEAVEHMRLRQNGAASEISYDQLRPVAQNTSVRQEANA
jgi:hypothetical protein